MIKHDLFFCREYYCLYMIIKYTGSTMLTFFNKKRWFNKKQKDDQDQSRTHEEIKEKEKYKIHEEMKKCDNKKGKIKELFLPFLFLFLFFLYKSMATLIKKRQKVNKVVCSRRKKGS